MDNLYTGKVSQKGQLVIPAAIRKVLDLEKGTKVSFELKNLLIFMIGWSMDNETECFKSYKKRKNETWIKTNLY